MKPRIISFVLPALIFFCGCATPDKSAGDQEQQAASTRQVIVVPIFILSPPQDSPTGGGDVLPEPNSPGRSTRRGEPWPAKM